MAAKRCFRCGHKMDSETGLCTNAKCSRSKALKAKTETKEESAEKSKTDEA